MVSLTRKDFVGRVAGALVGKTLAVMLAFAFNVVVVRMLGPKDAGVFFLAYTLLVGLTFVARFGMDSGILRYGGKYWYREEYGRLSAVVRFSMLASLAISAALCLMTFFGSEYIATVVFQKKALAGPIRYVGVVLFPFAAVWHLSALLKVVDRAAVASFVENGAVPLFALIILAVVYGQAGTSVSHVLLTIGVSSVLAVSVAIFLVKDWLSIFEVGGMAEGGYVRTTSAFFTTQMMAFLILWSSTLFLGAYVETDKVAYYSVAVRTAALTNLILLVVNNVTGPRYSALHAAREKRELENLAVRSTLFMSIIALPFVITFLVIPGHVLGIFGEGFGRGGTYLQIVAIGQFVNVLTGSVAHLLNMTGHEKIMRNNLLFVVAVNMILNITIVRWYGALGAAINTALCMALQNLIATWYVYKKLGIKTIPGWREISPVFARMKAQG